MSERYNNLDAMMERYKEEMHKFYQSRRDGPLPDVPSGAAWTGGMARVPAPMPYSDPIPAPAPAPVEAGIQAQAPPAEGEERARAVEAPVMSPAQTERTYIAPSAPPSAEATERTNRENVYGGEEGENGFGREYISQNEAEREAALEAAEEAAIEQGITGVENGGEGDTAYDSGVNEVDETMNDSGYITVDVFTAREAVPVPGADVVISRTDGGDSMSRKKLVRIAVTDSSGETGTYRVETVDRKLSEEPGTAHPFATYYVRIKAPGYETVRELPVDVFGGEISVVPVELIPVPAAPPLAKQGEGG